jgi:hypothetical protein
MWLYINFEMFDSLEEMFEVLEQQIALNRDHDD